MEPLGKVCGLAVWPQDIHGNYVAPITTEYWDDDGSAEYRAMFGRIEREGIVLEGVRPTDSANQFAQIRSSPPGAR